MPAGCLQVGHVVRAVAGPCSHLVRGEDVGPPLKQQLRSAHVAARARLDQGSTPVLPRHRARRGGGGPLASGSARVRDCLEARSEPRPARGNVRLQSLH